jgi:excinuclease ABC subunit C
MRLPIAGEAPRLPRQARLARLRDSVRERAENRPGVYRMHGPDDEILYVGKSIRVRTRLLSYFRARPPEKAAELIAGTARIEWEDMADEFSAILSEMKLIQRVRPRFNVEHKRKRRFAFAKITAEPAPRIILAGRIQPDGASYFGPFPSAGRIQSALRELSHALGLRDCAATTPLHFGDQLELLRGDRTPLCLRAELGSCLAPCAGGCSASEYRERVARARAFLEGRGKEPFLALENAMRDAAARHDYEYASVLRDRAARLRNLQEELVAFRGRVESLSFVYRPMGYDGARTLYLIRKGRIRTTLPAPRGRRQKLRVARAIASAWERSLVEPELRELRPDDAAEIFLVARWFRRNPEEWMRTVPAEEFLAS